MAKNSDKKFILGASGIFSYISFRKIRDMVEKIISDELTTGIFRDPPEVVLDIAFNNMRKKYFASLWDQNSDSIRPVAFDALANELSALKEDGLSRVGILVPGVTPFGNCCVTQFISSPKPLQTEELITRFNKLSGINVNEEDCIAGSTLCYSAEGEYRYLFSAVKNDVLNNIEQKIIGFDLFDEDFMSVRVVDRVVALSNLVASYMRGNRKASEADVIMCVEQSGDRLTLWNLCKLRNGHYAPLRSTTETIPKGESVDTLSNRFILFQQQLARERNFPMPKMALILTDGTKMFNGLFTMSDLTEVCVTCTELDESEISIVKDPGAAIKGLFEMEKEYSAERDAILNSGGKE